MGVFFTPVALPMRFVIWFCPIVFLVIVLPGSLRLLARPFSRFASPGCVHGLFARRRSPARAAKCLHKELFCRPNPPSNKQRAHIKHSVCVGTFARSSKNAYTQKNKSFRNAIHPYFVFKLIPIVGAGSMQFIKNNYGAD